MPFKLQATLVGFGGNRTQSKIGRRAILFYFLPEAKLYCAFTPMSEDPTNSLDSNRISAG